MTSIEVRADWYEALNKVKKGTELSSIIEWSFTAQDLFVLCCLHENFDHRQKIEDLLEDCNFHTECALLVEGQYDKLRKMIQNEMM